MKEILLLSFLLISLNLFAQQKFQLAQPLVKYSSAFFSGSTAFEALFNQPGAEIRYTLNGDEPTENDLLYKGPVSITKRSIVKLKSFSKDFLPSEPVIVEFIKNGKSIQQVDFSSPNETYDHAPKNILYDDIGGFTNFRGGTWLGYDKDSAVITISFAKKEKIKSVLVDMLVDENSWIFLPDEILLFYLDSKSNSWLPVAKASFQHDQPSPAKCVPYEIRPGKKVKADQLKLIFSVTKKIPDWHPGKGNHAWLFIDEIKVY